MIALTRYQQKPIVHSHIYDTQDVVRENWAMETVQLSTQNVPNLQEMTISQLLKLNNTLSSSQLDELKTQFSSIRGI